MCDVDTAVVHINTMKVKKTVIFHFVAVLLVTKQEKGDTDSNSKNSTTQHKQTFSWS